MAKDVSISRSETLGCSFRTFLRCEISLSVISIDLLSLTNLYFTYFSKTKLFRIEQSEQSSDQFALRASIENRICFTDVVVITRNIKAHPTAASSLFSVCDRQPVHASMMYE